jgi:RecJ-like exonuclease
MKKCPECNGTGWVTEIGWCLRCGGTGKRGMHGRLVPLLSPKVGLSPITMIVDFCSACHGTGMMPKHFKCTTCNGTGYIEENYISSSCISNTKHEKSYLSESYAYLIKSAFSEQIQNNIAKEIRAWREIQTLMGRVIQTRSRCLNKK